MSAEPTWDEVGQRYGTDKASTHHGYMTHYERLLAERSWCRMLEIGVAGGRSLAAWRELLPDWRVVGVDNDPESMAHQRTGSPVVWADAADPAAMAAVSTLYGPFDVVIDDGSHEHHDVNMAFEELYPRLHSGGLYIIEDLDEADNWVGSFVERWDGEVIVPEGRTVAGCLIVVGKP